MSAPAAVAQEGAPSPQELWDAYPLDPETAQSREGAESSSSAGTAGGGAPSPAATAGTGAAGTRAAAGERPVSESGDPSLTVPALVGAALLAFAVGLAAGQASRRRATATSDGATATSDGVPATTDGGRPPPQPRRPARPKLRPAALAPAPRQPEPTFEWLEPAPRARAAPPRAPDPTTPPRAPDPTTPPRPPDPTTPPRAPDPPPRAPDPTRPPRAADSPVPEPAAPPPAAPEPAEPPLDPSPAAEPEPFELPWRRFARDTPWPEADELWTCEIDWKPGYVKSTFRAMVAAPGERKRKPVAESPPLRWTLMMDPDPELPEVTEAVRALAATIERAGWERTQPGAPWFAHRFVWRGEGRPPRAGSRSRQGGTDA